jgi:HJR/Mrr/RecB family endonuclease
MNKKEYLTKLANRIRVSFYILLLVTIYEAWYWLCHGSRLSFVLVLLSGAVTYFAYTLMSLFDDMKNHSE